MTVEHKVCAPSKCWATDGKVRCPNCGHRPMWFPKAKALAKVQCSRCRCMGFELDEAAA